MASRAEITAKYARAYRSAAKKDKGRLLDEVVAVTGWSRDNARRRLAAAVEPRPRPVGPRRRHRARKYSLDALKVLQRVWALAGGECGKYLAAAMPALLDALERHGELVEGTGRYSPAVRAELLAMSPATIDRYLAPARAKDPLRGKSTTKPSPLLRNSIKIRKAGDEVEDCPGFFEGDTVAHCRPSLKGEFARTVNLTDMRTGWVFTRAMRNNAHVHVLAALDAAVAGIPFEITENNHLVRRYAYYWRYDTPEALVMLNQLWPLVNDRLNYFTPTKKPVSWATDTTGRRKRLYDRPRTPADRLLDARILSPAQQRELNTYRDRLNPAELARRIQTIQDRLTGLARDATLALQASITKPPPDTERGVRLQPAG